MGNIEKKDIALATELRHELHAHPELSLHEEQTIKRIANFLREHTSLEICERPGWLYAKYAAPRPTKPPIAFRADMDAIPVGEGRELPYGSTVPGVGHKCGHDGHCASLALLALMLERGGAERDVYLLFQPGEETGAGAPICIPMLEENNIKEIYACHNMPFVPRGEIALRDGAMQCASTGMILEFTGEKSHASHPEQGKNPAFAIAKTVSTIRPLMDPSRWKGMVLCTVIQIALGEEAFGTSAGYGKLLLTVRGEYESEMKELSENLCRIAREEAGKYSLKLDVSYADTFPETANTPLAAENVRRAAARAGISCHELAEAERASEDFGHLIKAAGEGAIFFIGSEGCSALHTAEFDFPDELIPLIAGMFEEILNG